MESFESKDDRDEAQRLSDQINESKTIDDLREAIREIAERAGLLG